MKQQNLHVGLVGPLPPPYGGMANQARQLASLLEAEGVKVHFVQTNPPYRPKFVEELKILRALFRLFPYVLKLWRMAGRVDVIHLFSNSGWSWQLYSAPAILIGLTRGTPVVINYRGGEAQEYLKKSIRWVRPTVSRGSALVVPSGYLRDVFSKFDISSDVIPNIINLKIFNRKDNAHVYNEHEPHLVVTRNLEKIYDLPTAINAVAIIRRDIPGIKLSIAGSGPEERELRKLVDKLGLAGNIVFTGKLSPEEVAELYQNADIMLNPTTVDNMPNSVLESLACGLPVVTTNVGGIPYIVEDEKTALFVDTGDAEHMARQVKRLLEDAVLYESLVNKGMALVRQYAWAEVRNKWLNLYSRLAHGDNKQPKLLVFSTLFPHAGTPNNGLFIRERMFRVAKYLPVTVVSPQPWFPGQSIIRMFQPALRPKAVRSEVQEGIDVLFPRYFSFPHILKELDGLFIALGSYPTLKKLKREKKFNVLDAHFAYPDGYAAVLLGRWLNVPVTITLRGTEVPHSRNRNLRPKLVKALQGANCLFSVSESLRQHAISLGTDPNKISVVANGVDMDKFYPEEKSAARRRFGIPDNARVMVSIGALVERKGFHRVIAVLPDLLKSGLDLHYLIVGGVSPEGNIRSRLLAQVESLKLNHRVHFLGSIPASEIRWPLSAADLFVLATGNEGWANVFLEAMACGLPVITTNVGGNSEVVCRPELGTIVPFGDSQALYDALKAALGITWDRDAIQAYASANTWDQRVDCLKAEFKKINHQNRSSARYLSVEV